MHASDVALYKRLLGYVKPYWHIFLLSIAGSVLMAATAPAVPALTKPLIDVGFIEKDPSFIRWAPILLITLFLVRGGAYYISRYFMDIVSNRIILDLRREMFKQMLSLPTRYYDQSTPGDFIAKFVNHVSQVKSMGTGVMLAVINNSLTIIALIGWMFYINWQACLIFLSSAPLLTKFSILLRKKVRIASRKLQQCLEEITDIVNECVGAYKLVKLYDGEEREKKRFYEGAHACYRYDLKHARASALVTPVVQLITSMVLAVIVYVLLNDAVTNDIKAGEFTSFVVAMMMIQGPLKKMISILVPLQRGLVACESIFSFLDQPGEIGAYARKSDQSDGKLRGEIEFRNVSFAYRGDGPRVLKNISLHIKAGENIALVGISGSGKSTITKLIPLLYPVSDGNILLDGQDIRDMSLSHLRQNIALLTQEVILLNASIRKNIAYGCLHDSDDEEITAAAEAAHALEFIETLEDGFDTVVGERGLKLSGGQRQRIAIARAFLKNSPILIMDEATSSLDTHSERQIQFAMNNIQRNRTCVTIAHRLSTIENSDRVIVIQNGTIAESGAHAELLAHDGIYRWLYQNVQ